MGNPVPLTRQSNSSKNITQPDICCGDSSLSGNCKAFGLGYLQNIILYQQLLGIPFKRSEGSEISKHQSNSTKALEFVSKLPIFRVLGTVGNWSARSICCGGKKMVASTSKHRHSSSTLTTYLQSTIYIQSSITCKQLLQASIFNQAFTSSIHINHLPSINHIQSTSSSIRIQTATSINHPHQSSPFKSHFKHLLQNPTNIYSKILHPKNHLNQPLQDHSHQPRQASTPRLCAHTTAFISKSTFNNLQCCDLEEDE